MKPTPIRYGLCVADYDIPIRTRWNFGKNCKRFIKIRIKR